MKDFWQEILHDSLDSQRKLLRQPVHHGAILGNARSSTFLNNDDNASLNSSKLKACNVNKYDDRWHLFNTYIANS
jgi:hypothetical protein